MFETWLHTLLDSGFMAHGYCLRWDPALLSTFILGNSLVAFSYFSIPAALLLFVNKRKDLVFSWMFVLFGIFIVACGTTHLLKIWTIYQPVYWAEAVMDLFTGIVSVVTACLLWPLVPRALELPSPSLMQEKNTLLEKSMEDTKSLNAELQELNEQLRVARDRAIEASNTKSAFVAAISHELRTPLTAILGMNELLSTNLLNREQQHLSQNVQIAANSLLNTVNDILDLSRLEAGKLEIETCPFQLRRLAADCLKNVESSASRKKLSLLLKLDENLPDFLQGDPSRIKQILTNLLGNAVKFTESGEVGLRIELLSLEQTKARLRFSVQDTGSGIAADDQERIFQPFTQADQSTSRQFGGTGLGLSIAQYLAELMSSHICVESQASKGSKFWFDLELPLVVHESEHPPQPEEGPMELPRSKILVVDDDPFLQKLARMQLEKLNMHITLAGSASQVYEFFRSGYLPDLVLMDCHMPEKDGYTLTRELREMQSMHLVPIIAVTAGAMKGDKERCLAAGMNDYLSKPYTLKQLSEVLRRCLPSATKTDDDISNLNPYQNLKPDSVMVDLKRLKQSYGEDAISEILATFFQSAPPLVRQLEECSLKRNAEEIKFLAHRLKGASSMACIDKIAASSKVLEISASEANWREIDTQISLLKVLILKARELYRQ